MGVAYKVVMVMAEHAPEAEGELNELANQGWRIMQFNCSRYRAVWTLERESTEEGHRAPGSFRPE